MPFFSNNDMERDPGVPETAPNVGVVTLDMDLDSRSQHGVDEATQAHECETNVKSFFSGRHELWNVLLFFAVTIPTRHAS